MHFAMSDLHCLLQLSSSYLPILVDKVTAYTPLHHVKWILIFNVFIPSFSDGDIVNACQCVVHPSLYFLPNDRVEFNLMKLAA